SKDISNWKATFFMCAPSFIRALFRISDPKDLQSLRLVVSGAEKTPQDLFDFVEQYLPNTKLLEGYGITECSPVVSVDRPNKPHKGVGFPISCVEIQVINPETQEILTKGQEGEICISGPNVFSGYLGHN